jgi:hypothetical protein
MAVLTAVRVSITDDVMFVVIDGEMAINLVVLVNSVVDAVLIRAEDRWIVFITVFDDVLVYVFEIFTDECHDWRFV